MRWRGSPTGMSYWKRAASSGAAAATICAATPRSRTASCTSSQRRTSMKPLTAGVTRANEGLDAISWNILGQTYVPKTLTPESFSWHATFPPGTFVPPHIHPTQDEFIYMLEGRLDLVLDGQESTAG